MTLTLDANIWIAAYDYKDLYHTPSLKFLSAATSRLHTLISPTFLLVEISCALARRTKNVARGQMAITRLRTHPLLILQPLSETLLNLAAHLGTTHFLRGADSLYVATAELTSTPLLSWDAELTRRANAITPSDWLAANP